MRSSEQQGLPAGNTAGARPAEIPASSRSIRFSGVAKRFGRRQVLTDAGLQLKSGHCHLLLGDNGAGKSTLMRIMAGLLKPEQASVDWGEGPRNWRTSRSRLQDSVVYLHQRPYLFDASMRDNIAYAVPKAVKRPEREEIVQQALAWAGLEGLGDAHANYLSGGERQRLALARAWARGAPVLLLDEPASAMDADARRRFYLLLETLVDEGRTLLLATHDPGLFLGLSPRALRLEDGRIQVLDAAEQATVIPLSRRSGA